MKTNAKLFVLALAFASAAASLSAQQFFLRGEAAVASAHKGPYDSGTGGITVYAGYSLDPVGMHEVSLSVGAIAWNESDVDRRHRSDDGTTTLWIEDNEYRIPSDNRSFSFKDGNMRVDDGTVYKSDYRPQLTIVPLMANYRLNVGRPDDRIRFFVGGGIGLAELYMQSKLWSRYDYDWHTRYEDDAKWSFTWNATAGVSIRVARHVTLDVSYAFQQFKGDTFHMKNVTYALNDMDVSMGRVGATYTF